MFARDSAELGDSDTDPMTEVSAHAFRLQPAEPQSGPPKTGCEAPLDHHIEEVFAALDDLA